MKYLSNSFLPAKISLGNGLLTQTMKLKRNVALKTYLKEIEKLF